MVCKTCGESFKLKKEDRYEVNRPLILDPCTVAIFECFDCPSCGCQNIANIREARDRELIDEK